MRKHVLKQMMMALLMALVVPCVNAQVQVGDILCKGNKVVKPADYDAKNHTAIGVVFYVDDSGEHGTAVALENDGLFAWGGCGVDTDLDNYSNRGSAARDIDGFNNTNTILEKGKDYPAFAAVDFENGWYLPAIGQLKRLYSKLDKVDESLSAVGGTPFSNNGEWEYWSSTENYICNAWFIDSFGKLHYKDYSFNGNKDDRRFVRAVRNF